MKLGGLETVQNALWLDGVIVQALSSDGSAGYALQLGRVTVWAPCLSKATGSEIRQGYRLGFAAWQYNGLGSELTEGCCSSSLVM